MDIVDLDTYPIGELASRRSRSLVDDARRQLAENGAFHLPGFLNDDGLRRCLAEAQSLEARAHFSDHRLTPYYQPPDIRLPAGDPKAMALKFAVGYVSRENIPAASPFRALFEGDAFLDFLRAALPDEPLYRYSEPRGSLNVTVMGDGDELGWHFDACELVASILFRDSVGGGEFDYVPNLCSPGNDNEAGIADVVLGNHTDVRTASLVPGDLLLFRGRYSLHRVRPVVGPVSRLIGLMSFDNVVEAPISPANDRLMGAP